MTQNLTSHKQTSRPIGAKPIWYIDEHSYQSGNWSWIVRQSTCEYFRRTGYANDIMEGNLGRDDEPATFFESHDRRGIYYFDEYRAGKKGYFTYDGIELFRLESLMPGVPMLLELKKVKLNDMEETKDAKNVYHVSVNGQGNVVTAGQNNSVQIGQMEWMGDIGRFKALLAKHGVPPEDVEEIATIVLEEQPDVTGSLPVKANSWIKKMLGKALDGIWHASIHTAGALMAEWIKGYYGIPH